MSNNRGFGPGIERIVGLHPVPRAWRKDDEDASGRRLDASAPNDSASFAYAASDIEHLPVIYRSLSARLKAANRARPVAELCHELLGPKPELPARLSVESFRNAWQLHPNSQAGGICFSWRGTTSFRGGNVTGCRE